MAKLRTLEGATLIEALISLILISIVLGVSFLFYTQMNNHEIKNPNILLEYRADSLYQEIKKQKIYTNSQLEIADHNVAITLIPLSNNSHFNKVTITFWCDDLPKYSKEYLIENK